MRAGAGVSGRGETPEMEGVLTQVYTSSSPISTSMAIRIRAGPGTSPPPSLPKMSCFQQPYCYASGLPHQSRPRYVLPPPPPSLQCFASSSPISTPMGIRIRAGPGTPPPRVPTVFCFQ